MWWQKYKDAWDSTHKRFEAFTSPSIRFIISGIGVCYFLAFLSLIPQIPGLIGEHGLLPVKFLKDAYEMNFGAAGAWEMKSLAWWIHSGFGLQLLAIGGLLASLLVVLGRFTRISLFISWVIYGSFFVAGQAFLSFQWDSLLLESGIVGLCLAFANHDRASNPWSALLLVRLLSAKVMLSAGLAKWLSGDIWWREGTALTVHFETQPLPTVVGWFVHQAPDLLLWGTVFMWVAEIVAPILVFIPGRIRFYSALCMILFQVSILLTGNYGFFNILTIVLILSFWVKRDAPCTAANLKDSFHSVVACLKKLSLPSRSQVLKHSIPIFLSLTLLLGMGNRFFFQNPQIGIVEGTFAQWRIQFPYGLFATMTYPRWEMGLSVSEDQKIWHDVPFYYKPTTLDQLPWVTPHMPRLDWMMWFAALHPAPQQLPWLHRLAEGIIKKEPAILALLPPLPAGDFKYIQLSRREYRFTDTEEHEKTGNYWIEETRAY